MLSRRLSGLLTTLLILIIPFTSALGQITVETITTSFDASGGVSIDDSGLVYVADFGDGLGNPNGSNIYKVADDGTIILFATGLLGASGNDFDSDGNLFQSNIAGNRVSKIYPDGVVTTFATTSIGGPVGIAIDAGDTVYVANCGINSISKIDKNGFSSTWLTSGLLQCPNGLTIDDDGNLYTCNFNNGNIIKITPDKQVSVLATLPGGRCGHLTYFEGVLYAVARCSHKIYEVTLDGDTTLIAGSGLRGNDDGLGTSASFNHPNGIEARRVGDNIELFVNDAVSLSGDCLSVPLNPVVIRKITIGPLDVKGFADASTSTVTISKSNLQANGTDSAVVTITPLNFQSQPPINGISSITLSNTGNGTVSPLAIDNLDGTFSAVITAPGLPDYDTISVSVDAGGIIITLETHPSLRYWPCGDVNGDNVGPNIGDLTYLVSYLFGIPLGPPPPIIEASDVNGDDEGPNIGDLTYIVAYLFGGGPSPTCN